MNRFAFAIVLLALCAHQGFSQTDWETLESGRVVPVDTEIYTALFGPIPKRAELMIKDYEEFPSMKRLKFSGLLNDAQFYYVIGMEHVLCQDIDNLQVESPVDGHIVDYKITVQSTPFYKGVPIDFTIFLSGEDLIFNRTIQFRFEPDGWENGDIQFKWDTDNVNSSHAHLAFESIGQNVSKIKYAITENEFTRYDSFIIYDLILDEHPFVDVTSLSAEEARSLSLDIPFERQGIHCLNVVGLDADGNVVCTKQGLVCANLIEAEKWKPIGKGIYFDPVLCSTISNLKKLCTEKEITVEFPDWDTKRSWTVDVEESVDSPGTYRVVNPYSGDCPYEDTEISFNYEILGHQVEYKCKIEFDKTNTYYHIIYPLIGYSPHAASLGTLTGYTITENPPAFANAPVDFASRCILNSLHGAKAMGSLKTIGEVPLKFKDFRIYDSIKDIAPSYADSHYIFELRLPGYKSYEFLIDANSKSVTIAEYGDGIDHIRYTISDKLQSENAARSLMSYLKDSRDFLKIENISSAGEINLEEWELVDGHTYTIFALSCDKDDNWHEVSSTNFCPFSKDLVSIGKGIIMENQIASYFARPDLFIDEEYEVELFVDSENPRLIYVKNPFLNPDVSTNKHRYYDVEFDRFMEIDLTDSQQIRLPIHHSGFLNGGEYTTASKSEIDSELWRDKDTHVTGYMKNGQIVFPEKSLMCCLYKSTSPGDSGDYRLWKDAQKALVITLPESFTLDTYPTEVIDCLGEPEYFDIMGRRVAKPSSGIYIVRRGNKVNKELIK